MSQALVIFKPDSAHRIAARSALWEWLASERDWELESLTWFGPPRELIESHYDFLAGRPFFPWLVDFMSALPVLVGHLEAEPGSLAQMRQDLGETQIPKARPGSLRERYGIGGGVNVMHLSDSPETGAREVENWSRFMRLDAVEPPEPNDGRPDHTYHLRSLAAQYAAGVHRELAAEEVKRLLAEETDLIGDELSTLCRILLSAFD